jgi:hypothetical protein
LELRWCFACAKLAGSTAGQDSHLAPKINRM